MGCPLRKFASTVHSRKGKHLVSKQTLDSIRKKRKKKDPLYRGGRKWVMHEKHACISTRAISRDKGSRQQHTKVLSRAMSETSQRHYCNLVSHVYLTGIPCKRSNRTANLLECYRQQSTADATSKLPLVYIDPRFTCSSQALKTTAFIWRLKLTGSQNMR